MTTTKASLPAALAYPKSHLATACLLCFLLALAFFVFPSKEVAAKRESGAANNSSAEAQQGAALRPDAADKYPDSITAADESTATAKESPEADLAAATAQESPAAESEEAQVETKRITVAKGDTLSTLFAKVGLDVGELNQALASHPEAKRLSRLNIGQVLEFTLDADGALLGLSSKLSALEKLSLQKEGDSFAFERQKTTPQVVEHYAHGRIESSLFADASKAGLSQAMTLNLVNLFNYDIDFARDIQPADEFELIYQRQLVKGKEVGSGHILAARFTNKGKVYTAVRHVDAQGIASYYSADGSSTRKAFIRTPVAFTRISSRFSLGRKHPILNRIRAHKGVDYAAAQGTPIKATANGKIVFAGNNRNGYGNYILLQHGKQYQTLYGHMKGFAKGMKNGATVQQGQIIGYVGMTGLATGPHLHYEFRVNGTHVDPLSHKLPTADPLSGKERQRFLQFSQPLLARMDSEKASQLVLNGHAANAKTRPVQ